MQLMERMNITLNIRYSFLVFISSLDAKVGLVNFSLTGSLPRFLKAGNFEVLLITILSYLHSGTIIMYLQEGNADLQ